jgi:NAD(P)H dehydrogenase (quinone)
MTTAVIGATGRVGSQIVRGLLARGDAVAALVRDPGKARRAFGDPGELHIRPTRLDDPGDLTAALDGIRTVFIAMGSVGIEGVLQRIAINAAAGISSIEQVTRLSVLNTSTDSLGINQRAHYSIDQFASSTAVPYSTIRPAIFSASLLAAAPEVRASRTWTGLAGSGRMALIDHRDAAEAGMRVLTDPVLWGAQHDLTGPVPLSWPEALGLLSAELGEPVTFRVAAERRRAPIGAGENPGREPRDRLPVRPRRPLPGGLEDRIWPLTCGGAKGTRTPGLLDANQTLFQLSYSPAWSRVLQTRGGQAQSCWTVAAWC